MTTRNFVKPLLLFIAIGIAVLVAFSTRESMTRAVPGEKGFVFELEDLNGQKQSLTDYKGKVVVLNFFTTWCEPCIEETPELERFEKSKKATLLLINRGETKEQVIAFQKKFNTTSTYLFDPDFKVSKRYQVNGQPETFIIDKDGVIRDHIIGPTTSKVLQEKVEQYK
ncbi:TlpA family protein disulfide reductase [Brevibacillus sp. SYSU BS000544]|uniref:TlpA family protein disulfide reductase n=1 Tax=Brevibacillus sp. SYSU BS000544 TaxID=3416443 RepID=UPI003CE5043D